MPATALVPDTDESTTEQITAYLSAVSHELRTPLSGIRGYAEMLLSGMLGEVNDRQRSGLGKIGHLSHQLESMVEDLIVVLQTTTGTFAPFTEHVAVGDLIERVRLAVAGLCVSTAVTLETDAAPPAARTRIEADPRLLERAVVNVVSNAVKFSPQGASVQISASAGPQDVTLVITDHGIGMQQHDLAMLFTPLFTAPNARDHGLAGPGLGLAVTDAVIRAHHGTLWITSRTGEGTTVTITIPMRHLPPEETAGTSTTRPDVAR